jgi:hypothetical protein
MARKQQRWCDHPASGSYSGSLTEVYLRGGKKAPRSSQRKAIMWRDQRRPFWRFIGHKPSVSKYLPSECFAKGNR